jgi:hypothetical protein
MKLELTYRAKYLFSGESLTKIDDFIYVLNHANKFFCDLKNLIKENNLDVEIYGSEDDYSTFCIQTNNKKTIKLLKNIGFDKQNVD